MSDDQARLEVRDRTADLDVHTPTIGQSGIDIRSLRSEIHHVTYDPGFGNTAAAESTITYISGSEGVLLHRGYRIEDIARECSFLEVAYLLIYGKLPDSEELRDWEYDITHHSLLNEEMRSFFDA
nr:citrate/2-methylcitrate synthase [Acidimicrobiia bacterium]